DQITVIAWVRAKSRPMWATIVKNWGAYTPGQFHFGLNQNGYLDIEIMSKAQENIQVTEDKKFPLGKWQHVAFVHTGTSLKLYRNGSLIDELPANGLYQSSSIRSRGIGTKISDSDKGVDRANPGHWDGLLDEIAIFNEAFSDEKIREIYETQL
ncbi:MAG: LamG domain-containing protein, partial [Lentisphaeraceae bacterium]|nr:LamG domain-containing protein [Lentisphaeraceae bacterium]